MSRTDITASLIVLGACFAALLSGTPNAFNTVSELIQEDMQLSPVFMSMLTGLGAAGLQLTVFSGPILDWTGPSRTTLLGGAATCAGYFLMSLTHSPAMLLVEYIVVCST